MTDRTGIWCEGDGERPWRWSIVIHGKWMESRGSGDAATACEAAKQLKTFVKENFEMFGEWMDGDDPMLEDDD